MKVLLFVNEEDLIKCDNVIYPKHGMIFYGTMLDGHKKKRGNEDIVLQNGDITRIDETILNGEYCAARTNTVYIVDLENHQCLCSTYIDDDYQSDVLIFFCDFYETQIVDKISIDKLENKLIVDVTDGFIRLSVKSREQYNEFVKEYSDILKSDTNCRDANIKHKIAFINSALSEASIITRR